MSPETPKPGIRLVERTLKVNAPVEAVWKALAEADEIARWFAPEARVQPGAGDHYAAAAATGDKLAGLVLLNGPPKDFVGTAAAFNNGLFRFSMEKVASPPYAWVWLSAYRVPQAEVDAFAQRWQNQLLVLFPEKPEGESSKEVK